MQIFSSSLLLLLSDMVVRQYAFFFFLAFVALSAVISWQVVTSTSRVEKATVSGRNENATGESDIPLFIPVIGGVAAVAVVGGILWMSMRAGNRGPTAFAQMMRPVELAAREIYRIAAETLPVSVFRFHEALQDFRDAIETANAGGALYDVAETGAEHAMVDWVRQFEVAGNEAGYLLMHAYPETQDLDLWHLMTHFLITLSSDLNSDTVMDLAGGELSDSEKQAFQQRRAARFMRLVDGIVQAREHAFNDMDPAEQRLFNLVERVCFAIEQWDVEVLQVVTQFYSAAVDVDERELGEDDDEDEEAVNLFSRSFERRVADALGYSSVRDFRDNALPHIRDLVEEFDNLFDPSDAGVVWRRQHLGAEAVRGREPGDALVNVRPDYDHQPFVAFANSLRPTFPAQDN